MGLFGGGKPKKLCPICGNPVSWFLPIKWNDQPLCDVCGGKLTELSADIRAKVEESEASIREYFAAFDANQLLRDSFRENYRCEFGLFGGCICLDTERRILRLSGSGNAFAYGPETIVSFRITEDTSPLFECTQEGMVCYYSAAPDKVRGLDAEISRYMEELRHAEHMRRMEEQMERHAERHGETYIKDYIPDPDVGRLNPFGKYGIYIQLEHPYRTEAKEFKKDAPGFNSYSPSIDGYLAAYSQSYNEMRELAEKVMAVINPDAPVREVGGPAEAPGSRAMPAAPAAPADPVTEIQRYKALLDSGVITDEEFTAKKRQLLGI